MKSRSVIIHSWTVLRYFFVQKTDHSEKEVK